MGFVIVNKEGLTKGWFYEGESDLGAAFVSRVKRAKIYKSKASAARAKNAIKGEGMLVIQEAR